MIQASQIKEHANVTGTDGAHVGTVDHMDGTDRIKLTKNDANDGQHHFIPLSWVASAEGNEVKLNKTASEAKEQWQADRAL